MQIFLIEPYLAGSHKSWCTGYQQHSNHKVDIFGLEGRFWKWRMHGAAITLAQRINNQSVVPELFICSDFLDLSLFKSRLDKRFDQCRFVMYFHENQFAYPFSEQDTDQIKERDNHYGFINYTSALVADRVFFNSDYNKNTLLNGVSHLLSTMPDFKNLETIDEIESKSEVLYLGLDLSIDQSLDSKNTTKPVFLWNHRWEYDKNPIAFFEAMLKLHKANVDFELVLLGERTGQVKKDTEQFVDILQEKIIHNGYVSSSAEYWKWLQYANVLPVTSNQDFFGISIAEAISCNVVPVLPKRLSYNELFADFALFYEDDIYDFLPRTIGDLTASFDGKSIINRLDWKLTMCKEYDEKFSSLINS